MSLSRPISDDWASESSATTFYNEMVGEQRRVGPSCDAWFAYERENVLEMKLRTAYCLLDRPPHIEQGIQRLTDFFDSFTPAQRVVIDKVFGVLLGLFDGDVKTIELSRILVGLKTKEGEHKTLILKVRTRGTNSKTFFIDHVARRYKDWEDFMGRNRLPPGYVVFPRNGQYLLKDGEYVIDGKWMMKRQDRAAEILDYFMLILGAGVGIVVIVGIFIPFASPIVLTAISFASFGPLLWGGGRCALALNDRYSHGHSISDLHSVPLWVGTAAAILGAATGIASVAGLITGTLGVADDAAGVLANFLRLTPIAGASVANICTVTSVSDGRFPSCQEIAAIMWSIFVCYNVVLTAREAQDLCACDTTAADRTSQRRLEQRINDLLEHFRINVKEVLRLFEGEALRSYFGQVDHARIRGLLCQEVGAVFDQLRNLVKQPPADDNNNGDEQLSISFESRLALGPPSP